MFTGLIEEVGAVLALRRNKDSAALVVAAPGVAAKVKLGDSVAVNGCCLTVSDQSEENLEFDLLGETLQRTNLNALRPGSHLNLECAVAAGAPLGGHFVQGHIDIAAPIVSLGERGPDLRIGIELPAAFARYVVFKGSIAVNGVSLTVAEVSKDSFSVWIIPHTKAHTNLGASRGGDLLNLEFDVLAKYVERMLGPRVPSRG